MFGTHDALLVCFSCFQTSLGGLWWVGGWVRYFDRLSRVWIKQENSFYASIGIATQIRKGQHLLCCLLFCCRPFQAVEYRLLRVPFERKYVTGPPYLDMVSSDLHFLSLGGCLRPPPKFELLCPDLPIHPITLTSAHPRFFRSSSLAFGVARLADYRRPLETRWNKHGYRGLASKPNGFTSETLEREVQDTASWISKTISSKILLEAPFTKYRHRLSVAQVISNTYSEWRYFRRLNWHWKCLECGWPCF